MPDPYTWLNEQGQVVVRTEESYAFYTNEDGQVEARPAVGLVTFDVDGTVHVMVPVSVETPDEPQIDAIVQGDIGVVAVVDPEFQAQCTHDAEIQGQSTHDSEFGAEAGHFAEIGCEVTWEPEYSGG